MLRKILPATLLLLLVACGTAATREPTGHSSSNFEGAELSDDGSDGIGGFNGEVEGDIIDDDGDDDGFDEPDDLDDDDDDLDLDDDDDLDDDVETSSGTSSSGGSSGTALECSPACKTGTFCATVISSTGTRKNRCLPNSFK